jgi:hypothetical protein
MYHSLLLFPKHYAELCNKLLPKDIKSNQIIDHNILVGLDLEKKKERYEPFRVWERLSFNPSRNSSSFSGGVQNNYSFTALKLDTIEEGPTNNRMTIKIRNLTGKIYQNRRWWNTFSLIMMLKMIL